MWQGDWTHWQLLDGTPVAVAGLIDDHSRLLVGLRAAPGDATTTLTWATFLDGVAAAGLPAVNLTDNGSVYSNARRRGTTSRYEANLRALGVRPVTSRPYHPQTCGKIERLWQTLKRWLRARPPAPSVAQLQTLLEEFRRDYNTRRPHRSLAGRTPAVVHAAAAPARPADRPLPAKITVTHATTTDNGAVYLHDFTIGVGTRWTGKDLTIINDGDHITIFNGPQIVRTFTLDRTRRYQPQQK